MGERLRRSGTECCNTIGGRTHWSRVEIIMRYAGASASMAEDFLAYGGISNDAVQVIGVAGTANGSMHHALEPALLLAQADGVPVVRASRCAAGRVLVGASEVIPDSAGL